MEPEEEAVDQAIRCEEEIEPFDWEDHLYESWLEEKREKEKGRGTGALNN